MYNLTNVSNAAGVNDYFLSINQLSSGWFAGFLLIALFILFSYLFNDGEPLNGPLAGSFLTAVVGLFLFLLGWISIGTFMVCVALLIVIFGLKKLA